MLSTLFQGMGFGFTLSLMIGPVFFGLLHTSITNGFKSGYQYAIGVFLSDTLLITISLTLASFLNQNLWVSRIIILIGAMAMCIMGLFYILKKPDAYTKVDINEKNEHYKSFKFLIKGFMLNVITPTVLLFWVGTSSFVTMSFSANYTQIFLFFGGCLGVLFLMDICKALLALQIKKILNPSWIYYLQLTLGILLFATGCIAFYKNRGLFISIF